MRNRHLNQSLDVDAKILRNHAVDSLQIGRDRYKWEYKDIKTSLTI